MIKLLAICLTYIALVCAGKVVLDNNSFLIYNKVYHKARLAQWGSEEGDVGTYEHALYEDQLWKLEPHPSKTGYYYIVNEARPRHRLTDYKHHLIVYSGPHYTDQLWKLQPSGNYYYISNYRYPADRLAKWGTKDGDVGVYSGPRYDDQKWRLLPRFEVNMYNKKVFQFDNRQGSQPIQRKIEYTRGVKRSTTNSISSKVTYTSAVEASLSGSLSLFSMTATVRQELALELATSFSQTDEKHWTVKYSDTFTIPAGKNYKIMQHMVEFGGSMQGESCTLLADIKVYESDSAEFEDPDHFLIK